jgi:hypothetical protein
MTALSCTKRAPDIKILATVEGALDFCHYLGRLWEIRNSDYTVGMTAPTRTKRAPNLEILATVEGALDFCHYLGRL